MHLYLCAILSSLKLNLHPCNMPHTPGAEISNLPQGVTVEDAYSDMMCYLMKSTRTFFENNTPNGAETWSRLREMTTIVLPIPYGWDADQHAVLRKAAVKAGLVEPSSASSIQFVSEGEASLHFALTNRTNAWLEENMTFAVMDVGGSTVNIGVFECISTDPIQLREVSAGDSLQVCRSRTLQPNLRGIAPFIDSFPGGRCLCQSQCRDNALQQERPAFRESSDCKKYGRTLRDGCES
jgi:hypothetical protein